MLELSPTQAVELGERAHAVHQSVLALKLQVEGCFLEMGRLLVQIQEERLYEPLGYATFEAYLAGPDLGLKRTQAYLLMRNTRVYGPLLDERNPAPAGSTYGGRTSVVAYTDLLEMGVEKADAIRQFVQEAPPDEAREWVAKAKALTKLDLQREVRSAKGGARAGSQYDYLLGVSRRLMAHAGALPESCTPHEVLGEIQALCEEAARYLEREGG